MDDEAQTYASKVLAEKQRLELAVSGESVQHALLKIMEGALVRLKGERYLDTRHILFIYGGSDNQNILDRLSKRVKPTDLFEFGLIPEFTETRPFSAHRLRSLKNNACAKAGIVQISVVRSLNHPLKLLAEWLRCSTPAKSSPQTSACRY